MAKATTAGTPKTKAAPAKGGRTEKISKAAKQGKPSKPNVFVRLSNYLKDVRTELRRTVWPARDEVARSSMVVVVTLIFFIVFLVVVDFIVSNAVLLITKV